MINKLIRWIKSLFRSTIAVNTIAVTVKEPELQSHEAKVMEQQFFVRKNNLVEEFAYVPTSAYSSNFNNPEPIGWLMADGSISVMKLKENMINISKILKEEYCGYMLICDSEQEMKILKINVDSGHTDGLITIDRYHLDMKGLQDKEELLMDDVDLLKNKMKPQLPQSKNIDYAVGNS